MNFKSLKTLLACSLLSFATVVSANSVSDEMYVMKDNVGKMFSAQSVEEFQMHLDKLRNAAKSSLELVPSKLVGKAADSAEIKDYQQGMQKFIDTLTEASDIAAKGDLNKAKEKAKEVAAIRDEYHGKYK